MKTIEICGKMYPLELTAAAYVKIVDKYGDIAGLAQNIENDAEAMPTIIWLLKVLIEAGAEKKAYEADEEYIPGIINEISDAKLMAIYTPGKLLRILDIAWNTIEEGMGRSEPDDADGEVLPN